jgi:hypothetical protein
MSARSIARPIDLVRLVAGTVALTRPGWLVRVTGSEDGTWPRRVTRILGARYLVQAGGGIALDRPWVPEVDGAIDAVHAVSMLGAAAVFRDHRRLALTSAVVATGCALADLRGPGRDLAERAGARA